MFQATFTFSAPTTGKVSTFDLRSTPDGAWSYSSDTLAPASPSGRGGSNQRPILPYQARAKTSGAGLPSSHHPQPHSCCCCCPHVQTFRHPPDGEANPEDGGGGSGLHHPISSQQRRRHQTSPALIPFPHEDHSSSFSLPTSTSSCASTSSNETLNIPLRVKVPVSLIPSYVLWILSLTTPLKCLCAKCLSAL